MDESSGNQVDLTARTDLLRKSAVSFCNAFLEGVSPPELLDKHFVPDDNGDDARAATAATAAAVYRPKITEHGPAASRLPFLGVTFAGRRRAPPPGPGHSHHGDGTSGGGDGGGEGARTDIGGGASARQKLEKAEEKRERQKEEEGEEGKGGQRGGRTCDDYFVLLGQTLKPRPGSLRFPAPQQFLVNPLAAGGEEGGGEERVKSEEKKEEAHRGSEGGGGEGKGKRGGKGERGGVVMVTGKAIWASVRTDMAWEEDFVFRLSEFDEECRIGHWEIWADPLSAWLAVGDENA